MLLVGVILLFGVALPALDHPDPSVTVTGTVTKTGYRELCEQSGSPVAADMGSCPAYTLAVDGGSNPKIPPGVYPSIELPANLAQGADQLESERLV